MSGKRALLVPLEHSTGLSNTVMRGLAMGMPMVTTETASRGAQSVISEWPYSTAKIATSGKEFIRHVLEIDNLGAHTQSSAIGDWSQNLDRIIDSLDSEDEGKV